MDILAYDRLGWITVLLLLVLPGCASAPGPPTPVLGELPAEGAGNLARRWEAEWRQFQGLRAAVDLNVVRKGRAQRSAGVLLLSPTRLRFEVVTAFGLPVLVVTAGPERVLAFSLMERRAWTGRPTAEAMNRWLGLPIEPNMLIRILAGQVPPPADPLTVRVVQNGTPHLAFARGPVEHQVWVTAEGYPLRLELKDGQHVRVTFERTVGGGLHSLTLEVPGQSLDAQVRYIMLEPTTPPEEAFELEIPPGVPIDRLD